MSTWLYRIDVLNRSPRDPRADCFWIGASANRRCPLQRMQFATSTLIRDNNNDYVILFQLFYHVLLTLRIYASEGKEINIVIQMSLMVHSKLFTIVYVQHNNPPRSATNRYSGCRSIDRFRTYKQQRNSVI